MNVTFAQTFLEVVKAGNLNRAAARLHVTESTVTTRLNALENLLGQKLLIRSRSGAELTSAGFKFQRYAETMTQAWGQARQELSLSEGFQGVCNIGCHFDLWEAAGRAWSDQLRRDHPDIALSFWAGNVEDIDRWLASGLVDAALIYDAPLSGGWQADHLFDERLVLVSTEQRVAMDWDPDYIYVDHGSTFRRLHAEAFPVAHTPALTISTSAWAIEHLLKWGGSGYLPLRLLDAYLGEGRFFKVTGAPEFTRGVGILSRPDISKTWPWFAGAAETLRTSL